MYGICIVVEFGSNLVTRIANCDVELLGQTSPGADEAVPTGLLLQYFTSGTKFAYVSTAEVKLTPVGLDGKARIAMSDGSTLKGFVTSSDITANITTSGANGLDTGAEASSTFYHLWAIGKSDGTLALLLSTSATSPTMPSGYTFKRLMWGVANDSSSHLVDFVHLRDGKCMYLATQLNDIRGANVLNAGSATSPTAIDLSKVVPDTPSVIIGAQFFAQNINITGSVMTISEDSSQTVRFAVSRTIGNITGGADMEHWTLEIRNTGSLATSFYYDWGTSTANIQAYMVVQWWTIGTVWGV